MRRRFHRPATLDPHERVLLLVEGAQPPGRLSVNGTHLGQVPGRSGPVEFDITPLLGERNEVVIEVAGREAWAAGSLSGWLGEVRLVIRGDS